MNAFKLLILTFLFRPLLGAPPAPDHRVELRRVPDGGIQPQAVVGSNGDIHLVYFRGKAAKGDLFYVRSSDHGTTFSKPTQVNSKKDSAVAVGTIRGAHISLGPDNRIHVAWNGSDHKSPRGAPFFYARLNDAKTFFEPQRNLMTKTRALDGGGSVTADRKGNVYAVWHANEVGGPDGEGSRAVWVAVSTDSGKTFSDEVRANKKDTGACGCCGLRAFADAKGNLYVLYRTATKVITRDMHLLVSRDRARSFTESKVDSWNVPKCIMSLADFSESPKGVVAAWETKEEVFFGFVDDKGGSIPRRVKGTGLQENRKHPSIAANANGAVLLSWTEGTRWKRGGSLSWQLYDKEGRALSESSGHSGGVPVWSFPAAVATAAGNFLVLY